MDERIRRAHENKVPFWMDGKILDHESGQEYFNRKVFAGPYCGPCFVGRTLFETWVDSDGLRNWRCLVSD